MTKNRWLRLCRLGLVVAVALMVASPARRLSGGEKPMISVKEARFWVKAYCPGECCCGEHADGVTATGNKVTENGGKIVAVDPLLIPYGSDVFVPGYGWCKAWDTGGALRKKGNQIEVLFASHNDALRWGSRMLHVGWVERKEE